VLEVLRERGGELHLIAGDFNALTPGDPTGDPPPGWVPHQDALSTAPRDVMRIFGGAGYADCFRQLHRRAAGYTYTARWPWLRLDRILASPTLARRCLGAEVLQSADATRASDHLPLLVTFQRDDAAAAGK
jgi:exonuclease III